MSLSNFAEALVVEFLNGEEPTEPAGLFVQLHTGAPGENCTDNVSAETSRVQGTFTSSGSVLELATPISWDDWDAGAETITHVSVWSAATDGNPIFWAELGSPRSVQNGDDLNLNTLTLTLD